MLRRSFGDLQALVHLLNIHLHSSRGADQELVQPSPKPSQAAGECLLKNSKHIKQVAEQVSVCEADWEHQQCLAGLHRNSSQRAAVLGVHSQLPAKQQRKISWDKQVWRHWWLWGQLEVWVRHQIYQSRCNFVLQLLSFAHSSKIYALITVLVKPN